MLILGLRTFSNVSNYPYLLLGNLILSVLTRFFPENLLINLGSVAIYHNDLTIFFLLLTMFAHRGAFTIKRRNVNLIIGLSLVSILFSLFNGFLEFGFNNSVVYDVRKFVYHIILVLFATTCDVEIDICSVMKWIKRIAYTLVIYIYVGTILHYAFGMQLGAYTDERPLPSHYAISLVVYIIYEVYEQLYKQKQPSISVATVIAIVAVVINRFNTTWIALFAGIILLIIMLPEKKRLLNSKFFLQTFVAIILLTIMFVFVADSSFMEAVFETGDKFNNMSAEDSTFGTRLELWALMLGTLNKVTIWTGLPMGSGYGVNYRGSIWQFNPHNGYIETIMRVGVIGCALLVILYLYAISASLKRKHYVGVAIIVAMMIYFVAYTYEFELSFILGYIIAESFRSGSEDYENEYAY